MRQGETDRMPGDAEIVARLALACFLGVLIGLERRLTGHPAGERTFALVALGACVFTVAGVVAGVDPTRVAAQVVTGIGFVCTGVIIHREGGVKGLTTAASLWFAAAAGVAVGVGEYVLASAATGLAVLVLLLDRVLPAIGESPDRA